MRILLIEDDAPTAAAIELMLHAEAFNVYTVDTGQEGIELANLYDYDAVCLDLTLPDMPGFNVIRQIRAAKVRTPILVLCAMADIADKVKALGLGADDYMTKPFHKDELVARLHALVRRANGLAQSIVVTGNLAVNLHTKTVKVSGADVHLTGKEYQMIEFLSLRKGMTLSKEAFLAQLYGGMDEPEMKIIDVFICKLRKKLKAVNGHPIETVWGRGYVLRDGEAGSPSMAAEVADLSDDPPTGFVPNQTYSKFKDTEENRRRQQRSRGVHIKIPATV